MISQKSVLFFPKHNPNIKATAPWPSMYLHMNYLSVTVWQVSISGTGFLLAGDFWTVLYSPHLLVNSKTPCRSWLADIFWTFCIFWPAWSDWRTLKFCITWPADLRWPAIKNKLIAVLTCFGKSPSTSSTWPAWNRGDRDYCFFCNSKILFSFQTLLTKVTAGFFTTEHNTHNLKRQLSEILQLTAAQHQCSGCVGMGVSREGGGGVTTCGTCEKSTAMLFPPSECDCIGGGFHAETEWMFILHTYFFNSFCPQG